MIRSVESSTIRIGRRNVHFEKSDGTWRLTAIPSWGERIFGFCLLVLPLTMLIVSEESLFHDYGMRRLPYEVVSCISVLPLIVAYVWPAIAAESLMLRVDSITISRCLWGFRKSQSFMWKRLQGPDLMRYYGKGAPPVQMLFQDQWAGTRAGFGFGASRTDAENVANIVKAFRTSAGPRVESA